MLPSRIRLFRPVVRKYSESAFIKSISPDHINALENETEDSSHQISVLMDELTRERLLVKQLRDESEALRTSTQELTDLRESLESQKRDTDSFKRKLLEAENRLNDARIQYKDLKDAMELERVKLTQSRSLPIILAGLSGVVITYLMLRAKIELEKQQFKYLKFELENMWLNRIRELDSKLQNLVDENKTLRSQIRSDKPAGDGYLSIWGKRLL